MIKVFLADDHEIVREGLRRIVSESPDMVVCGDASSGEEVLERAGRFQHFLSLYRGLLWDEAEAILHELLVAEPDCFLYNLYLERIAYFRENPPGADWDGVFTFVTK